MEVPVIRRTESYFAAGKGCTLFRRAWLPPEPERLLVLVHGYAEHSGRYEHLGAWLAARGCAVHAYDHRGHGRSDGVRGHVRRFADLLDDLEAFLAWVRDGHAGLPTFLVGHSMGGLVVAAFVCERNPELAGAVTSGAALRLAEEPSGAQRLVLRMLRRVAPRLAVTQPIAPEALSRDPEVGRAYLEDPLVLRRMSVSLAAEIFDAGRRTLRSGSDVRLPMLLLHGDADPLCLASGSRSFHEQLGTAGSDLRIYPELRHEIFNEPEQESIFTDLLEWLREREGS